MAKFKIGDIVVANQKSNVRYSITNQKNGFVGVVTHLGGDIFSVKTLESSVGGFCGLGCKWPCLESEYFDLAPPSIQIKYGRMHESSGDINDSDFSKLF